MSGRTYAFIDIGTLNKFDDGLKGLSALPSITAAQKAKLENQIKFIQKVRDYGPYYEYNWQKFLLIPSEYYGGSIEKPEIPVLLEYTDAIISEDTGTETTVAEPAESVQTEEGQSPVEIKLEAVATEETHSIDPEKEYEGKLAEYRRKKLEYFKTNKEQLTQNSFANAEESFLKKYLYYSAQNRYDDIIKGYDPDGVAWLESKDVVTLQEIWDNAISKRNGDRVFAAVDCLNMVAQAGKGAGKYTKNDLRILFFFVCLEMYNDINIKFNEQSEAIFVYYYEMLKGRILDAEDIEKAVAGLNIAADMKEGIRIADSIAVTKEFYPDIQSKIDIKWIYTSDLVEAVTDNPLLFYITFCNKFYIKSLIDWNAIIPFLGKLPVNSYKVLGTIEKIQLETEKNKIKMEEIIYKYEIKTEHDITMFLFSLRKLLRKYDLDSQENLKKLDELGEKWKNILKNSSGLKVRVKLDFENNTFIDEVTEIYYKTENQDTQKPSEQISYPYYIPTNIPSTNQEVYPLMQSWPKRIKTFEESPVYEATLETNLDIINAKWRIIWFLKWNNLWDDRDNQRLLYEIVEEWKRQIKKNIKLKIQFRIYPEYKTFMTNTWEIVDYQWWSYWDSYEENIRRNIIKLLNNTDINKEIQIAILESKFNDVNYHEQGGYIVRDPKTGKYYIFRETDTGRNYVNYSKKYVDELINKGYEYIGTFHTHPDPNNWEGPSRPGNTGNNDNDLNTANIFNKIFGGLNIVIGANNIYWFNNKYYWDTVSRTNKYFNLK